ncbi:MAG: allantoinase PuuE [Rhodospirillaceae bacterium]
MNRYPRDMRGHGPTPPDPQWPGGARIAVQIVLNYEEGGENCLLHGDAASEAFLSEIVGAQAFLGKRHWNMESIYEYGARAGFWRLHRLFTDLQIPITVYGVATALARSPEQVAAMLEADWELASHGLKWIDYKDYALADEQADMQAAIDLHTAVTGSAPRGWYTGRCSVNTVDMLARQGGFAYVADSYADDLPYWYRGSAADPVPPVLIVPYTLDANDMRFATPQGFNSGEQFFHYLKDSFDALYREGQAGAAKMLSIGLHCRLIGRPGRIEGLRRFLDYARSHDQVWFARRLDIAEHWASTFPLAEAFPAEPPSRMEAEAFVSRFGGVFEHSPWIAEGAHGLELGPAHDSAVGLHNALCRVFRMAGAEQKRAVLRAHPDLAGKLAQAKRLTAESTAEQAGAGLDALTDAERTRFTELNEAYKAKFGFPFILAVKGLGKAQILAAFKRRIDHDPDTEFAEACKQVERIALLRLKDMLP